MKVAGSLTKLIIFAVVTIFLTGVLAITISNSQFRATNTYKALFSDVTGVVSGDDVRIAGVRVGSISGVKVVHNDEALLTFTVDRDIPLQTSTVATLRYRNLIGQRYLQLSEGPSSGQRLRPDATLPRSQTHPALDLTVLFNGFKPLFRALTPEDVNKLSYEIIQVLQGEGGTVDSLIESTASLTNTLADRDAVVGRVVDNLNTVLATVDQRDQGLADLIDQLQRLTSGLSADRDPILNSLDNINSLAASTASLIHDIRPSLQPDIANLSAVTGTLATTKNPDGSNVLDEWLQRVPKKLNAINRTASYGSWFNFYLCAFDAPPVITQTIPVNNPYCNGRATAP